MVFWIRRFSRFVWLMCFFSVLFVSIDYTEPFNSTRILLGIVKGIGAGALAWLSAFVIADILFKGAVEDIEPEAIDELDGGVAQRIREQRLQHNKQGRLPV
jgi:hypothetical protein